MLVRELAEKLSSRELSELAELADTHVRLIERGERLAPSVETISRLACVLGVSLDWLIRGDGPEPTAEHVRAAVERARAERKTRETSGNGREG